MRKTAFYLFFMLALLSCEQKPAVVHVSEVSLDKEEVSIVVDSTITLTATVLPDGADDKRVVWASEDEAVAVISDNGVVTGVAEGRTDVTVATIDGNYMAACRVYVTAAPVSVTSVSLDKTTLSMKDNETYTLTATVLPENASNKAVTWSSDNTEVLTVSSTGVLTPQDEGNATVTVTTVDGGYTASCAVQIVTTHSRKRPSGTGWTITPVPDCDGITLYNFCGTYLNKSRNINVVDVDTSRYALKFYYTGTRYHTSDVLKNTRSIVAMNGAYETASIYIKIDGSARTYIENDEIGTTGVANWKNDGAVQRDKKGMISFKNTILREADSKGSGSYGLTLASQRNIYKSYKHMGEMDAAFSSAPLMIFKYKPLGLTFVPAGKTYYDTTNHNSEDPYYHQSQTHPRTAIAMDRDGHILMITVDGRQTKTTPQRIGLSCKDLTQFLIDNFDPKFALNMDGGGSTTLCIAGMGDETTHVVNHPIDDDVVDQERYVTSFFYVVSK